MENADQRDISLSIAGDGAAYARLIKRYQQSVAGRMWKFTRDRAALDELVHEVFVEAYFSLRRYRGDAPLIHWLNRIATRVGYRYWRRQDRTPATPLVELEKSLKAADALAPAEAAEALHALLAKLPPRDRLVLTLMYIEERSVAETAELIGWSRTMVKVQAHRARNKLRRLLEAMPPAMLEGLI